LDPVTVMGLVFTPIIAILCLLVHRKKHDKTIFYFGAAYVLYFLSYIIAFSGPTAMLANAQILLRLVAYLIIIIALYVRFAR